MLRAVLVEKREEKMRIQVKATWENYCPSSKTIKASGQSCKIYTPYSFHEAYI